MKRTTHSLVGKDALLLSPQFFKNHIQIHVVGMSFDEKTNGTAESTLSTINVNRESNPRRTLLSFKTPHFPKSKVAWVVVLLVAIVIVRTSLTSSPASAVEFLVCVGERE